VSALAPNRSGKQYANMTVDRLTQTVRNVLAHLPCSERALARAAGLSSAVLPRIRGGSLKATPATAKKLARALEVWSKDTRRAAERIRSLLPPED
jgi:predicted transcriptional regulator